MSWRDELHDVAQVLKETRCGLCPNVIGDAEFTVLTDPPDTKKMDLFLSAFPDTQVVRTPGRRMIMFHWRCIENASMTL